MYTARHCTLIYIISATGDILCVDIMKDFHMSNKAADLFTQRLFMPDRCIHALMSVRRTVLPWKCLIFDMKQGRIQGGS